jgi:hypothetical protein
MIICSIIGGIVASITGISVLFWVVSIFFFICSLPFTLIGGFIDDKIDYVQDREDDRALMRELREDERMDKYLNKLDDYNDFDEPPDIYIDNRQVNINNYYNRPDKPNPFIKGKNKKKP